MEKIKTKQAGAELGQAQDSLSLWLISLDGWKLGQVKLNQLDLNLAFDTAQAVEEIVEIVFGKIKVKDLK